MKENDNLRFFDLLKEVPEEAKKPISGGKLNGMTDINPMWRIKAMTEAFGPCGIGWRYEITRQWNEAYGQVVKTYCNINLYVKVDGEWSAAIPGTGGSSFVSITKNGAEVSDENMKMALTDALSVAMKALGVGADVYWKKGKNFESKYQMQNLAGDAASTTAGAEAAGAAKSGEELTPSEIVKNYVIPALKQANSKQELVRIFNDYENLHEYKPFMNAMTERKNEVLKQHN